MEAFVEDVSLVVFFSGVVLEVEALDDPFLPDPVSALEVDLGLFLAESFL